MFIICINLMANNIEHLFLCLFVIRIYFLITYLSNLCLYMDSKEQKCRYNETETDSWYRGQTSVVQWHSNVWLFVTPWAAPGFPVHHQLPEFTQSDVHQVGDAIQPSHPLSSPSPPTFNLSHHQGLFKWVSSSHQVAKVLEFQLQYQSFQWIFRTDFL